MFIIVDLPDPEVPTIAMNSRDRSETDVHQGANCLAGGRTYVLPMLRNSIIDTCLHCVLRCRRQPDRLPEDRW